MSLSIFFSIMWFCSIMQSTMLIQKEDEIVQTVKSLELLALDFLNHKTFDCSVKLLLKNLGHFSGQIPYRVFQLLTM